MIPAHEFWPLRSFAVLDHTHWQILKRLSQRYRTETRVRHFGYRPVGFHA